MPTSQPPACCLSRRVVGAESRWTVIGAHGQAVSHEVDLPTALAIAHALWGTVALSVWDADCREWTKDTLTATPAD